MPESVPEEPSRPGGARDPARLARLLTAFGVLVAIAILALGAVMLRDARGEAWRRTRQDSENLALTLARDIERAIAADDAALQRAADVLLFPGLDSADEVARHDAAFARASHDKYLDAVLVVDANGNVILDSASPAPREWNPADRDAFRLTRTPSDADLHISQPARGRFGGGDPKILLSRRIPGPDGQVVGNVIGVLRAAYFRDLFGNADPDGSASITLLGSDGGAIARSPGDPGDGRLDTDTLAQIGATAAGSFVREAPDDAGRRLYTYRRLGALPLLLVVAVPVDQILGQWERKAMTIGLTMVGLCGAIGIICLLFRREVLRRAIAESRLIEAATELSELATTDGLTGIANRRAFDLALRREWRRSSRTRKPIALLMIDVDFFKMFNDRYGHQDGDWALRGVAACLQNSVKRPCDLAARYGGEEFAALLQETDAEGALVIAERIRDAVARLAIPHDGNPTGRLTISIGVASTCPGTPDAEALLVKAADLALYDAKRAGRDRVGIAGRDVATIAA